MTVAAWGLAKALIWALLLLVVAAFLALYVPSSPVSSPGSGGVPAAPVTAGTSSH